MMFIPSFIKIRPLDRKLLERTASKTPRGIGMTP